MSMGAWGHMRLLQLSDPLGPGHRSQGYLSFVSHIKSTEGPRS